MGALETRHRKHTQGELDAHAVHLRYVEDYTLQQIADEMDCSVSTAHGRVRRGYAMMPGRTAVEQKLADLRTLDELERLLKQVIERPHVMVQNGKVVTFKVRDVDGIEREIPVPDDSLVIEGAQAILKVHERRARSVGNDAPTRRSVEVLTKDALTESMERMNREMAANEEAEYGYEGAG